MRNTSERHWISQLTDVGIALFALAASLIVTSSSDTPGGVQQVLAMRVSVKNGLLIAIIVVMWNLTLRLCGLHRQRIREPFRNEVKKILAATLLGSVWLLLFPLANPNSTLSLKSGAVFGLVTFALCTSWRLAFRLAQAYAPPNIVEPRYVLIVGTGAMAETFSSGLAQEDPSTEVIGFVDFSCAHPIAETVKARIIGTLDSLEEILVSRVVDEVMITLPARSCYNEIQSTLRTCERVGVQASYQPIVYRHAQGRVAVESRNNVPVLSVKQSGEEDLLLIKRMIDVAVSGLALVLLSPLLVLIGIVIKITAPGPVFFVQERFGLNKHRFRMFKFRTMVVNAEALQAALESQNEASGPVFKIKRDPRVTRTGQFLRKTSLDELPQLFNVLRGDMSLVGPRPLPIRDVSRFGESWLMRRFSVRPGLTCLWQVTGRSDTSFDKWIALDLEYIDKWSLGLDFKILVLTVPAVLRGTGAA